jgi:hypothetical protein
MDLMLSIHAIISDKDGRINSIAMKQKSHFDTQESIQRKMMEAE